MQTTEITVQELKERLDRGGRLFLFDVRSREDFERWRIEARAEIEFLNVPYAEMAAAGGPADPIEAIRDYVQGRLAGRLPPDRPIVTVCARGVTSQDVTRALGGLGYEALTLRGGMEAWGNYYEFKTVVESPELGIYQVVRPARGCLSYVIASREKAVVVDPLRHVDEYLCFAERKGLAIERVLDTHAHADHISGGPALAERLGLPYHLHPYDGIHPLDALPAAIEFDYLWDGREFTVGRVSMRTIHIPGHTLGNVAYLVAERYLLTGDSIFLESIARPDLGGRGEAWAPLHYRSLKRLLELPEDTSVLPGHYSLPGEADERGLFVAPLGELKLKNEGLLLAQKGEREFVDYILKNLPEFPEQYIEIKRVNAGLLTPDEAKAAELELGRNICALAHAYRPG